MSIENINSREVYNIEDSDWFDLLTEEQRSMLHETMREVHYIPGETIIKQGYAATHILFVESGVVKLNVENRRKTTTFKFVNEGNFIGLMCSFVRKKLDFSAVAVSDVQVALLDRDIVEKLIRENGDFAIYMVMLMSELTNELVRNLINMSHKNANGSIATILLDIYSIYGTQSFPLPFNRTEMAHALGYSKESVINTLKELQKDGIISVSGREVTINDMTRLVNISHNG
jgi:CRP-like cAMP-binding protein